MRVDMSDWEGNHAYTLYDSLLVDDEASNYTIYLGNYSGDAGDALRITMQPYQQKIMPFSTYDHGDEGLAKRFGAGFWYNRWFTALPTGRYTRITDEDDDQGVIWDSWKQYVSLKEITMSVRPKGVV
ncbi:fibrinogen-like protein 1 [Gigantopelta aegis]|uniref:fibrinogen-like protein 1 n=1 Tax=Gigantopelta aegis TaxID=1735272 RepID=UPI001B888270|nr:fibrinogen-like protein 1 [Gigantopelta aegis]